MTIASNLQNNSHKSKVIKVPTIKVNSFNIYFDFWCLCNLSPLCFPFPSF
jgi:hypothetical protein